MAVIIFPKEVVHHDPGIQALVFFLLSTKPPLNRTFCVGVNIQCQKKEKGIYA